MKKEKNELKLNIFFSRLWSLLKPSHRDIKFLSVFIIVIELLRLIGPYFLKLIIDLINNFQKENVLELILLILGMFVANQFVSLVDYFTDKKIIKILVDVESYLAVNAFKKLLYLPLSYHEKENTGNKITRIDRGIDKIDNFLVNLFWEVAPTFFQIIFTMVVLLFFDWRFAVIYLFITPIFVFLTYRANSKIQVNRTQRHADYELSSGKIAQAIININTVKSLVQEKREINELKKVRDRIMYNGFVEFFTIFNFNLSRGLLIDIGRAAVLFVGIYFVWMGSLTVGSLVFIFTISEKALLSLFRISRIYDRIMEGSEAVSRLYLLSNESPEINSPKAGVVPKNIQGKIEFRNVTFGYGGKKKVLDHIDLKILSGGITALVGPSGGGKTTVARMIYRHYDPQSGVVTLDDVNLKDYDLYSFRKFISIVPQEVEIFNGSVKENIAYAVPGASDLEIIAAAKIANAHEFVEKLSHKYNTEVGERGIKLSGGQRQRIGIARAILANPRVLIFDEATSNLDSYSEKLIQEAIDKIKEGRTIIIIAHRLSTIKKADKIVVLENGRVVEEGSHYELSQIKGGLYAKLNELQRMGDVE